MRAARTSSPRIPRYANAADAGAPDAAKGAHGGTWPTFAHDQQRTSRAQGAGAISTPQVAWQKSMGGILSSAAVGDVDGDGRPNVVVLTGGRVTATNPDGTTLWQGPLEGARAILGIWNLDGVGTPEVVVSTAADVEVLDGATGTTLTTLPVPLVANADFAAIGPSGGILALTESRAVLQRVRLPTGRLPRDDGGVDAHRGRPDEPGARRRRRRRQT